MEHTIVPEKTGQEGENTRNGHEAGAEAKVSIGRDKTRRRVEAEAEFETGEDEDVDNVPVVPISKFFYGYFRGRSAYNRNDAIKEKRLNTPQTGIRDRLVKTSKVFWISLTKHKESQGIMVVWGLPAVNIDDAQRRSHCCTVTTVEQSYREYLAT